MQNQANMVTSSPFFDEPVQNSFFPNFYCDHGVFEYDVGIFSEIVDNFAVTNWKIVFCPRARAINFELQFDFFENRTRHK